MRALHASIVLALLVAGCSPEAPPEEPPPEPGPSGPFTLVEELDRSVTGDLWPGFDPRSVPFAIYDGERTLLFGHPSPPEEFTPVAGRDGVHAFTGRHPSVVANSNAEIGGVQTATLLPTSADAVPGNQIGILVHEAFHVFQAENYPDWGANEADLFTYPFDNAELLTLRRLETEGLRRALVDVAPDQSACWARTALEMRGRRFAALPGESVEYERAAERHEGLAAYIETKATGAPDSTILPEIGFAPESVRARAYQTGAALARLLDRFSRGWPERLIAADTTALDELLDSALPPAAATASCGFTSAEVDEFEAGALADVNSLRTRHRQDRQSFLEMAGWRLDITAPGTPLFPQGFDPLNVSVVAMGEVLHTRYLRLGGAAGEIEVRDRTALTSAAGDHPMFEGVRTVTVTGLTSEPDISEADGMVTISAEGLRAELRGATVERSGQTILVRLPG